MGEGAPHYGIVPVSLPLPRSAESADRGKEHLTTFSMVEDDCCCSICSQVRVVEGAFMAGTEEGADTRTSAYEPVLPPSLPIDLPCKDQTP